MSETPEQKCLRLLTTALKALQQAKPADRTEPARRYAITITDLEKVIAYYAVFVLHITDFN
jgi:hypothetical protein